MKIYNVKNSLNEVVGYIDVKDSIIITVSNGFINNFTNMADVLDHINRNKLNLEAIGINEVD